MLLDLVISAAMSAPCAAPVTVAAFAATLDRADASYLAMDGPSFGSAVEQAERELICMDAVVSPTIAAHYHRVQALALWARPDEARAIDAIEGAKRAEPSYTLSTEVLPADHPLALAYTTAPPDAPTVGVPRPARGSAVFDGLADGRRPTDRATIFQVIDGREPLLTAYVAPSDPLPAYPHRKSAAPMVGLGGLAIASLAASGGTYQAARATHDPFWDVTDTSITRAELEVLQARSQRMAGLSAVFLVVGLGASTGAVVVRP